MAVRSKEEIIAEITKKFGEDTSDETISLIEDVTDTLDNLSGASDGTDWKAKYEENDKEWRQKYVSRFSSKPDNGDDDIGSQGEKPKKLTFENLFKEEEK